MSNLVIRKALSSDLNALIDVENACFNNDKLSPRSLKRWLSAKHGILLVAQNGEQVCGYGLVWCHKGTRLARLYSLAVKPTMQGKGVAKALLTSLEKETYERGRIYLRLEVAVNNEGAIGLYKSLGYRVFGQYSDYYDDHSDALRMQKNIRQTSELKVARLTPWYQQTTEFTCGPAALLMAMGALEPTTELTQSHELALWREGTTIFMTSGHGGCHPFGLAIAANKRGFKSEVMVNTTEPLFLDGVRNENKKMVLATVHQQFVDGIAQANIPLKHKDVELEHIEQWLSKGFSVLLLISTYSFDGKKSPHWVCVTHLDEHCVYVHDPFCEPGNDKQLAIDCQYVPIARSDFSKMSAFGSQRLRTAVAIANKI
ncbi:GNAT family N-acetyltransferase/peptidase C39 family protein [Pseudoalteromonas sp. HL-AS1]|uniref:GNAT family N-acetyltransferase/peptidase C39 family protein n=1 Tax=Pseudoalteromonas sp. HL-AS1 TaxID=3071081 RepID=UPI00281529EF|nr:GNAT family N-acetyltransferase/peptidase C39 family protein [Pseudoalteromonas sp. HL-AS1]WMS92230.1 GNAT family N-acetyltransferase/peptidase C39 family protein [Pseudoalteromonas sp. HL-AS1]